MDDFVYHNPTKIIFGRNSEARIGEEISAHGKKVLVHFGGESAKRSGLLDQVTASLSRAGLTSIELGGVVPNPRLGLVREGIALCRKMKVDAIVAVGGGSVIDSAKAIAMGLPHGGDVWDFYSGKAQPSEALPLGVILTIPAAGSESSPSAVLTNEDGMVKRGFSSDLLYPRFAILNPELAFTLPRNQMANGVADMMSHLLERYFTNSLAVEFVDRLIEASLRSVLDAAPRVLAKMDDYDAWSQLMWAGTIAHNNLLGMGRVGDWASHKLEHELSAAYDIAHGAGMAVVFPAWMRFACARNPARFAQLAARLWGEDGAFLEPERAAMAGIARLESFWNSMGLATRLPGLGIGEEGLPAMAAKCCASGAIGNFVKIGATEAEAIYRMAF